MDSFFWFPEETKKTPSAGGKKISIVIANLQTANSTF